MHHLIYCVCKPMHLAWASAYLTAQLVFVLAIFWIPANFSKYFMSQHYCNSEVGGGGNPSCLAKEL